MKAGLDSATPPTTAQTTQARKAGVSLWNGYIATRPGVGLARSWTLPDFDIARQCGGTPIGYASGWDNAAAVAKLAQQWNVRLCLDVESGIRGDGTWVQPWLDASGAGLYGTPTTQQKYHAPFRVMATYVANDPQRTWLGPVPSEPHGWQWQNSHNEFGVTVDRCWFDDWFVGDDMTPEEHTMLQKILDEVTDLDGRNFRAAFDQIYAGSLAWQQQNAGGGSTLPQDVQDAIRVIAAHIK